MRKMAASGPGQSGSGSCRRLRRGVWSRVWRGGISRVPQRLRCLPGVPRTGGHRGEPVVEEGRAPQILTKCGSRGRSQFLQGDLGTSGCTRMQMSQATALLTLCLSALCQPALGTEGKRKLQIGVKKRVENCPIKSRKGDVLHMHYTGKLEDGTEFDSSIPRDQPFIFSLGTGQVIKGWDQGLLGMCEGEKRKLVIPSELGYGDRGAPPKIPGGATLIFEVELLKIERRPEL
ncbi:peptidyl-prolyl cis-trans isomerase FKBP2 isoform X2 [Chelonia mydas]|uniref:peptidyl-prolyl cis-trans isomerase FKBP2 isoform X2 n=1 Tax=Chelonia mydas TaxID=8469 RepID=UPI000FFB19D7|nr:peptidyl-prolyl cis-trans isomerase FKBP2 isoform X2 [Chelonia mydas]